MILKLILLSSVAMGVVLLARSLLPAQKICQLDKSVGWRILVGLISLFILGYVFLFVQMSLSSVINPTFIVLSAVLFGGAIFVALVIPFSLNALLKLNKIAQEERYKGFHDSLTGLPNRKHLFQSLEDRADKVFTLFLIDLNNFKQINDGLGHYMGDRFLVSVAKRILSCVPDNGQMFRLGGDEFAIIVDTTDDSELLSIVDTIHQSFKEPVAILTYSMNTSASIGMAKYPKDCDEVFSLLKQSDLAMYYSKKNDKSYTFYHEALGHASYEKLKLSQRLTTAIHNDEFQLYFQPIIDASSDSLVALEALLRWPQADGSFIMPDQFLPLAEKSALINLISEWVIKEAARNLITLREAGFTGQLHVNLSAKDIQTDAISNILSELIDSKRLNPNDMTFEITEHDMVEDIAKARAVMKSINEMGFSFSVDDFGTGFSSLVILRELPIDEIKIDRSFIQHFDSNDSNLPIISHVLNLANDLNCSVVAEGVETEAIKNRLIELGATRHQGYLYSRPIDLNSVIDKYKQ
ncbi:EAL domain-containing protein [Vibrio sp.]|uniref:Bifunctional diguanylate cyclase/phosphodiesterase n=1 Tax=Vibrio viridaestus TaxID=2487322 RepID=A0A3N9TE35_9VIBR|nr:bifunctional diguanylate cyclase/phosphodiesterase [Vibrio viridaestus]MDC0610999.1 EAL domain-containing protein [Vibrio sp.]RQW62094.1 bifunctional diguanylate cyclase/phosphodiesterase [Vibrio viridaestus]